MKVSKKWDHIKSFEEICKESSFSYFFKKGNSLAPCGIGRPHIVSGRNKIGVKSTVIGWDDGVTYEGDTVSGHAFIKDLADEYTMDLFICPLECINEYFKLLKP